MNAVELTAAGEVLDASLRQVGVEHDQELSDSFDAGERRTLLGLLSRLETAVDAPSGVHPEFGAPPRGAPSRTGRGPRPGDGGARRGR